MKLANIKIGIFSLLAIFCLSVFLISCEKDIETDSKFQNKAGIDLSNKEIAEGINDQIKINNIRKPDYSLIPENFKIPELDEETISKLKTEGNIESRGCLTYNGPSYHSQIGLIYAFEPPVTWVWSYNYDDWIWLDNEEHLCCCWVMFHTNNPICGKSGWMIDNNVDDAALYHWGSNGWSSFNPNCNGLGWKDPLPTGNLMTSDFGPRPSRDGFHSGVDFGHSNGYQITNGKPVLAVAAGTVITSTNDFGRVTIDHGTYLTSYVHMKNLISNGTPVAAGQQIGTVSGVGEDGDVEFDPHLHFEYYDPKVVITDSDTQAKDPSVEICRIAQLGLTQVNTDEHSQYISIQQYCQSYGVTR